MSATAEKLINTDREPTKVYNLSDVNEKRRLIHSINMLNGLYEVRIKRRTRTRSLDANRYYWSAYIPEWTEYLRREYGDPTITAGQAHVTLKCAVLDRKVKVNEETGVCLELVPTSHDMSVEEFSIYLEQAAKFLAEFAGIVVLPSEMFAETK